MTSGIKRFVKLLVPPGLIGLAKWGLGHFSKPEWEYVPEGWRAAQVDPAIKGWAQKSVLEAYVARWPGFLKSVQGTGPFGLSPEAQAADIAGNLSFHNVILSYAYALNMSAIGKTALTMLDWGGGIGHYYVISQALRPDLQIDYHCKDFQVFTEHGQRLFPEAHFHADAAWKNQAYDLVLASSSLHYTEDWRATLAELAQVTKGLLFITRLPVIHTKPSYVMVQRPYAYGYNTEYLGWCLNRSEVLTQARASGLELLREFVIEAPPHIHRAPEPCHYWGFLFRKSKP